MKKRNKLLIYVGISPLIVTGIFYSFAYLSAAGSVKALTLKSRRDNLLYHTYHKALLAACRTLMKEGYRGKYMIAWPDTHPDVENFPQEILALKPSYISVLDDGRVIIEMWGGMSHYGVVAYAEDFKEPYKDFIPGNKKLIDGLWFYSDFIDLSKEDN